MLNYDDLRRCMQNTASLMARPWTHASKRVKLIDTDSISMICLQSRGIINPLTNNKMLSNPWIFEFLHSFPNFYLDILLKYRYTRILTLCKINFKFEEMRSSSFFIIDIRMNARNSSQKYNIYNINILIY